MPTSHSRSCSPHRSRYRPIMTVTACWRSTYASTRERTRGRPRASTIGDAISWNAGISGKRETALTEPPQDARYTFCVNIWSDFEVMTPLLEPTRLGRYGGYRRAMEAMEKRENADGRERESERERRGERRKGGPGRASTTGNLMRSRVTENCLTYRFYWNVRRPRKNGARGPNW